MIVSDFFKFGDLKFQGVCESTKRRPNNVFLTVMQITNFK